MNHTYEKFAPFFPIDGEVGQLALVEPSDGDDDRDDAIRLVMRFIVFDQSDGQRVVRNIKEQEIQLGPRALLEDGERVDELMYAWQDVLREVLSLPSSTLEAWMPSDFVHFRELLRLKTARTRGDFSKALRARSRLGRALDQ